MSKGLEFLKDCFDNDEAFKKFEEKVDEKGIKVADLSTGDYVAKKKYDDKVTELNTLQTKYTDLERNAQTDEVSKTKISDLEKELGEYKTKYETLDKDHKHYLNRDTVISNGFKKEFADFVVSEINKNVSDTIDFETAMKGYKAKNPQFTEAEKKVVIKQSSMPNMNGNGEGKQNNNDFMNSLIRGEQ